MPGMPALVAVSLTGFSGYAALLATAPAWAVQRRRPPRPAPAWSTACCSRPPSPPSCSSRGCSAPFGTGPVLVASMLLMGLPPLAYAASDALRPVLAWSAVRGTGFGIVTVVGSTVVAHLVSPAPPR